MINPTTDNSLELQPWLVVLTDHDPPSPALWRLANQEQTCLAMFSTAERAEGYAQQHCPSPTEVCRLGPQQLVRLLADCFRQGMELAALDPGESAARQVFRIREVLSAAKQQFQQQRAARDAAKL